jgi:hypothetical protein
MERPSTRIATVKDTCLFSLDRNLNMALLTAERVMPIILWVEDLEKQVDTLNAEIERLKSPQSQCGHPQACIVSGDKWGEHYTTNWCAWCAEVAQLKAKIEGLENIT